MDDVERKMFAQFDDDMPAQRVNALEMLREHLKKQKRGFRDIVAEIETAAGAAAKITALEAENIQARQINAQAQAAYNKLAADHAALRRRLNALLWLKKHGRGLAVAAAVPLIAGAAWCFYPTETAAHRAAVNARFNAVAGDIRWQAAAVDDAPVVVNLAAGEAYWVAVRFDQNTAHENAAGEPVTVRCVHLYAAPAVADAGAYLKPHPYSLFGFGWLTWPERGTSCKADFVRKAGQ